MAAAQWEAPEEYGHDDCSVFLDIELWRRLRYADPDTGRQVDGLSWSRAFLSSVWRMLRLGLLRDEGRAVAVPYLWGDDDWPDQWADMPTVTQVNAQAAPFAAYRAFSVLPQWCLPVEHAVRTVLNHVNVDPAAMDQTIARAAQEGITLPASPIERLSYVLLDDE
jgi:hypothetical protein